MSPLVAARAAAAARGYGWGLAAGGPTGGFEAIATVTATGSESTLSFTSIPQGYSSLHIRGIARCSAAVSGIGDIMYYINSDTVSNYPQHYLFGSGSGTPTAVGQAAIGNGYIRNAFCYDSNTAGVFGTFVFDMHDYASTSRNKTVRYMSGVELNGDGRITLGSTLWLSTSAVNGLSFTTGGAAFVAGTTFALYGIKGAA